MSHRRDSLIIVTCIYCSVMLVAATAFAQNEVIGFDSDEWGLRNAEVTEHLGRTALTGSAYLENVEFENGVIEVDIAVDGSRSYPGIVFRRQSQNDYEHVYIRPHRAGLYPDALQYAPVFNGIGCWQLFNGEGYTAGIDIPENEWIHVKLEVSGKQARVFLGGADQPSLVITDLKHGVSRGAMGVTGPRGTTAYFSNFSYRIDDLIHFEPPPEIETPPGFITEWHLSQSFKLSEIDTERYPDEQTLASVTWQRVTSDPSGLVNVSRYYGRSGREPDLILAKTTIHSKKEETKKYAFGYSDAVVVFLNGEILFVGESAYRQRDPSFLGIIGLHDAVYLPLEKGDNELLLMVAESFGGWGFMCQDAGAVFLHEHVKKKWESANKFSTPETVVYDPSRKVLYVTNFDTYNRSGPVGMQAISKVALDGSIEEMEWITGLYNPLGMAIAGDRLYVVEPRSLVEIDIREANVLGRQSPPQPVFLNDIAIDQSGNIYVSDSGKGTIYKFTDGSFEEWVAGGEINRPNGLHVHRGNLIVGNNGDHSLKSVDLESKEINTIVTLGPGIIDGVETDRDGNYLVSHWEGKVYRITPEGQKEKILDTTPPEIYCANFAYVADKDLLFIPTFFDNRVIAYKLSK